MEKLNIASEQNLKRNVKKGCQKWRNDEMKNFHRLDRSRGYGLKSMSLQAKSKALGII